LADPLGGQKQADKRQRVNITL